MKRNKIYAFGLALTVLMSNFAVFGQTQNRGVAVRVKNVQGKTEEIKLYNASYALVIGAGDYKNGWNKLRGVKEDVSAVKSILTKHNFIVEELIDPTSANLLPTINEFVNKYGLATGNRLLIYFAGHGYTETAEDERKFGYIVPTDAPDPAKNLLGFQQKAVTMDEIETVARKIRSKHALFVFDSCFSGSLVSRSKTVVPPFIDYLSTQPVRQFITAGADNQEVPDQSVFRQMFVRGLEGEADANKDDYITGTELAVYLQERVIYYRGDAQTPQFGKIRDPRLDRGDFVFVLPKEPVIAVTSNTESTAFPSKTKIENTGGNSNLSPKVSPVKVAVIDTSLFADEKRGITQFINAYKQLEKELTPRRNEIKNIEERLKKIQQDYNNAPPGDLKQLLLQTGEKLQKEYNLKVEEYKSAVKKREATVVDPIYQQIGKSLSEMEKQNGVSLLDISKDEAGYIVWANISTIDNTTNIFINSYNKGETSPYIDIPQSKIGSLDTSLFADEKTGIKQFINVYKQLEKEFTPRRNEIKNIEERLKKNQQDYNNAPLGDYKQQLLQAGERLQKEHDLKVAEYKSAVEKREKELAGPVYNQIGKAIGNFAKENGFNIMVDIVKKVAPEISALSSMPKTDVTRQFIDYYSRLNP